MKNVWANVWWAVLLRGLVAVLFGLGAFFWPDLTVATLALLYTPYAVADGARPVNTCCWAGLVHGGISILAGIAALAWPGLTTLSLLIIAAVRAALGGLLEIVTAVQLRQEIEAESLLILDGMLSIIVAVLLLANPGTRIVGLASGIGAYAVLLGLMLASLAFNLRHAGKQNGEMPSGAERAF
jgi:uncharacterized membrane protein HdeD (DUF308 family)